jgi:PIN domain nuclease of toxin-antitoxin system
MAENKMETVPVRVDHVLKFETLAMHHNDFFDRMLIAQSLEEELPLVTGDRGFAGYPVQVIGEHSAGPPGL